MIYRNGNVEFQSSLNEKESKWWQNRIQELGSKSEIISRNPAEVTSVEEAIEYLKDHGKMVFKEALCGSDVATSVCQAYNMFFICQDPGSRAFLEIAVNDYIQSKRFTLSIENPDCELECPRCGSTAIIGPVGKAQYNTCDKCAKSF